MQGIVDFLVNEFQTNQFFTAALLAAPAAMLTYSARAVPKVAWNGIKRAASVELRFNSDMEQYFKVQEYVTKHIIRTDWSRNFSYHYEENHYRPPGGTIAPTSIISAGYGNHIGWWRGKPVWVRRHLEQSTQTERFKESLQIIFLARGTKQVQHFVKELSTYIEVGAQEGKVYLYSNNYDHWRFISQMPQRPPNTVITVGNQMQAAIDHITRFEQQEDWYYQRGLPYHTGLLLTGLPGTGKSSFIQALATATGRSLYYLNLAAINEEGQLTNLISCNRNLRRGILVIEDFDVTRATVSRKGKEETKQISLSSLLNILDGMLSPHGMVVAATTNHPETLDPALLRPGRFDVRYNLEPLDWPSFLRMAQLFELPMAELLRLENEYKPCTGATLRALFLQGNVQALEQHFKRLNPVIDTAA